MKNYLLFVSLLLCLLGCDNSKEKSTDINEREERQKPLPREADEKEKVTWTKSERATALKDCMKNEEKKGGPSFSADKTKKLCLCKVNAMADNVTYNEYIDVMATGGDENDKALQKKVKRIRTQLENCEAENTGDDE